MFIHNFKYSLKVLMKNKILIFWTIAFPLILGTLFHMAFSNIENSEKLKPIKIAIIENNDFKEKEAIRNAFHNLEIAKDGKKLLDIKYTNEEKAQKLLEKSQITGYLTFHKENIKITVKENGIKETILKYIVDEIQSTKKIMENLIKEDIQKEEKIDLEKIYQNIEKNIQEKEGKLKNTASKNLSYTMIEYYTLIAMACLYGAILSMFITNYKLANMNSVGKRTSISPIHKIKLLLGSLLASYIIQIIGIAILFFFTIYILKVDFGKSILYTIPLALLGSLAGLTLGVSVATLVKAHENTKTGILIAITMFASFLSGMMGITMKYIIDKNVPIINKINPASMITDGFYALYYYDTKERYIIDLISLLLFSILMIAVSYKALRRQKYDSI